MGALSRLLAAASLAAISAHSSASPVDRWKQEIALASRRFGIPQTWIRQVMEVESGGRTALLGMPIVSAAGAMGLMQLMPGTWTEMRDAHRLGPDPFDPRDNILAGTAYLRAMYDRFGYPGLFAAYNAGPARYQRFLAGEDLPSETVRYVRRVALRDTTLRLVFSPGERQRARSLIIAPVFLEGASTGKRGPVLIAPGASMLLALVP